MFKLVKLLSAVMGGTALLFTMAATGEDWDVENTGQPYSEVEFTLTEGTWMSVDVSPDGNTLLFDLLGDIYALDAGGGKARLIHGGAAMQRDPKYSPDGKKILFISDKIDGDSIWISNPDGSGAIRVTQNTLAALTGPSWSADGSYITAALMSSHENAYHHSELRQYDIMNAGDGRLLVPTPIVGENVHEPQFSPDGRYLYYTEKVTPITTSYVYIDANIKNYAIKQLDLQTGETVELIKGFGGATTSQISPDGSRLGFVRRIGAKTVLFDYNMKAQIQKPVYADLDRDAQADFGWQGSYYPQYSWFPDNIHVAIWAGGKLWKINMDNGDVANIPFRVEARHRLADVPDITHDLAPKTFEVKAIRQPTFSPDGKVAVFNALGRLWQKNGKATPKRVSDSEGLEFEPSFAPDGKTFAYIEWHDVSGGKLVLAATDGSWRKTLLESGGALRSPSFSPDGKHIVYGISYGDRCVGGHWNKPGIYVMDIKSGESRRLADPGEYPQFSPNGQRIYFTATHDDAHENTISTLESIDISGYDRRVHITTPDADTSELRISPNLRWIAFRDRQKYYVARYSENGRTLQLTAATTEIPVQTLTEYGGYGLTWAADSSRLHWAYGATFKTVEVSDFLKGQMEAKQKDLKVGLEVAANVPEGSLAFVGARLITMVGEEVIEDGTVVIENNRIKAIGAASDVRVPKDAKVIDVKGKTIMPGLVDMHGHINHCYYTSSGLMPQKHMGRYAALAFGVTTNYDPYNAELPDYSQAEMTLAGEMVGPRAIGSGFIAYGRMGKNDYAYVPINSYKDADIFMKRKKALGGLTVKDYKQPMRRQRQQLVKAGFDNGVMVDVEGQSYLYHNITMIIDGHMNLQHNLPIATYYNDIVQLMAHGETAHTPATPMLFGELHGESYIYEKMRVWDDPKVRKFVQWTTSGYNPVGTPHYAPPYVRGMSTIKRADEIWDIGFRAVARSIKKLDDAGVIINIGSHGQVAGLAQHWDMWLLSEGGMSNHRLLKAATLNGAKTLGVDHQIGSLEKGKLADLIVLGKNPLENIYNSNTVELTVVNGRLYETENMDEIGNYDHPREKFYWEVGKTQNIVDYETAWAHQ